MDYQKVISELQDKDVINLLLSLGADRYKETADAIIFPTICHNVDAAEASMKLYYYKNTKLFYCYTADGGMNIFKLNIFIKPVKLSMIGITIFIFL